MSNQQIEILRFLHVFAKRRRPEVSVRVLRLHHSFSREDIDALGAEYPDLFTITERKPENGGRPSTVVTLRQSTLKSLARIEVSIAEANAIKAASRPVLLDLYGDRKTPANATERAILTCVGASGPQGSVDNIGVVKYCVTHRLISPQNEIGLYPRVDAAFRDLVDAEMLYYRAGRYHVCEKSAAWIMARFSPPGSVAEPTTKLLHRRSGAVVFDSNNGGLQ